MRIDLCYHLARTFSGRKSQIRRNSIAHISVLVRHRAVEEHSIHRPCAVTEKRRHLSEEFRRGGAITFGNPAAHVVRYETGVDQKGILVFRTAIGSLPAGDGKPGIESHPAQFVSATGKGVDKGLRHRGAPLDIYMVAALYQFYRLVGAYVFHKVNALVSLRENHCETLSGGAQASRTVFRRRASTHIRAAPAACCL